MKKKYIYCEMVLLFTLVLLLSSLIKNKRIIHSQEILKSSLLILDKKIMNDSVEIAKLRRNIIRTSTNFNFRIDSKIILESENGQLTSIHGICNGKPKIVFRFNEFSCRTCIYEELDILKEVSNRIGQENILIIASYKRKRDLYISKRVNDIEFDVYNLPLGVIKNNIDNLNIPYVL